ncbi:MULTISPECIES: diaminopimelate epimerase [Thiorhodovibrio]|uniref:diaminopimelate epimerase n=1 Tax=Thiorhodovibrio TaxID=61593 RepID=UPI001911F5EF|nr:MULTISPECIES: diaminopimelate epimerase [Thiorhodovibrio]MBK5968272.1 diaminopimelate epimerase [Thiorhodovibrio winogradskyi]WPL13024.1 Diaminopimelate epimerase [Thiorhodovibrio litoralis]
MRLKFTKMHGLGNDFVVIDAINQQVAMTAELTRMLADRRRGVGCDQLLLVEHSKTATTNFYYRIFNADGSEVGQCGNGARCFARFVHAKGLTDKRQLQVGTKSGLLELNLLDDGQVRVDMGMPRFEPRAVPFLTDQRAPAYNYGTGSQVLRIGVLSMGNPHAVVPVDDLATAPVDSLGPEIERSPVFPQRTNVGFMQVFSAEHIGLRVWERGAGETQACGSGACAAMVVGRLWGELDEEVRVTLPGGDLIVRWPGNQETVTMTGPACEVFDGEIDL